MPSQRILKRTFHGLAFLLIAIVAYFQAKGAGQLIGMALTKSVERKSTLPEHDAVKLPLAPSAAAKDGQAIRDRNPFDSTPRTLGHVERSQVADTADPLSWPACDDVHVLIISESSDPGWSLATLQTHDEPRPRLRRVGDGIAGKQVAFIGYNPKHQAPSVWLESSGTLCQSTMFRPKVLAPVREPMRQSAPLVAAIAAAEIPRHQASIMGQVRVVPEQKDGKMLGLRLFGIRPGSVLGSLGLRNGDRLESINGFEIASPEKALQAYAQLRSASHLHVLLTRVGKPLALDLNII
jgi:general secretion pathway protein C